MTHNIEIRTKVFKRHRYITPTEAEQAVKTFQPVPHGAFMVRAHVSGNTLIFAWPGNTVNEVLISFADFLCDPENDVPGLPEGWRVSDYDHAGEQGATAFRADWVAGFDVVKK